MKTYEIKLKTISEMSLPYIIVDVSAYGNSELEVEINVVGTSNWKKLIESILAEEYLPAVMVNDLIDYAIADNHAFAYNDTDKLVNIVIVDKGSK